MNRRQALLLGGISAASLLGLLAWARHRASRPPRQVAALDESTIDWTSFLQDWNAQARRAIAEMLIKHGLAGPPAFGAKKLLEADIANTGGALGADVVSPIAGSISTASDVDAVLRQAREYLQLLEQHVNLRYEVVSYQWEVIRKDGLFHPPGDQQLLAAAEQRLGVTLPPSFRAFVLASNGWLSSSSKLIPLQQVQAFGKADPQYVQDWSRDPPVPDCLLISQPLLEVNERLLLNPQVRFENQELEAWFMTPRIAGAIRYRSFTELMRFMKKSDEAFWRWLAG